MDGRFRALVLALLAMTAGQVCTRAYAQEASDVPDSREEQEAATERRLLSDIAAYFTAPLHWDAGNWEYFGGTLAALAVAHEFDGRVRTDFTRSSSTSLNGSDTYDLQDALPAAVLFTGTWLYSGLFNDADGRTATGAMAEAAGLSVVTGYLLTYAVGRERPDQTTDPNRWGAGGSSFPSLHATAAFAVGTVFAESGSSEYLWLTRFIGYGVAVATSYERLNHNAHWLSDVVAGAGLGASSAVFVLNRTYGRDSRAQIGVAPLDGGGFLLTYRTTLD
jgi:membrane-associated phospholipid phosphatase